ncbi:Histone-lysine N-methyltransferase 2D [Toxocara canis]|uniref:Histone-lysine N-methyltransferase 2D n=1 Tax=Toxocara canis TaxID=6265 RepID=A0A0B2UPL3_TOXCA|nr:Histone-lysine N-methyltransferase 2D [Toxocara canis]
MALRSIGNSRNRRKYGQRDHSETSQCKAIEVQVHSPPIKTRRWAKMRRRLIPRCRVCKGDSGALMKCIYCQRQYHLRCLEYECERERSIAEKRMEDWLCPACALCTACGDFITDAKNVQCLSCDRAYHGACRPSSVGYPQSCESFKTFFCPECMSKEKPVIKKEVMDLSAATHHSANGRSSSMHSSKVSSSLYPTRRNNSFLLRCALGPKYPLQQQRDQVLLGCF